MYSLEDRSRAVELYTQCGQRAEATIRQLGFPSSPNTLRKWYREFITTGRLHKCSPSKSKFTLEAKRTAVQYYMEHGQSLSATVHSLGYPSRGSLRRWVAEAYPQKKPHCLQRGFS